MMEVVGKHSDGTTNRHRQTRSAGDGPPVTAIADRQLRLFVVTVLLVSAPSLGIQLYTQPPSVDAHRPPWAGEVFEDFAAAETKFNARAEAFFQVRIWGLDLTDARPLLRNERVNVYVQDRQGQTAAYSFRFDQRVQIRELRHGTRSDATVRVVVDRSAVQRIDDEYTQTRALRAAYMNDRISVTGVGPSNWLRFWLVDQWVKTSLRTIE